MAAIVLEADEIIVKPFEAGKLADLSAKRCLTASLLPSWKNREWARYCGAVLPVLSKAGYTGKAE